MNDHADQPLLARAFRRHYLLWLWLPLGLTLVFLGLAVVPYPSPFTVLSSVFAAVYAAGLLFLFVSSIVRFVKKRLAAGLVTLAACGAAAATFVPALAIAFSLAIVQPDDFAAGLTIPADIDVTDPSPTTRYRPGDNPDTFQAAILAALESPPTAAPLTASLPSLATLQTDHSDLLARYLASHPGWRVYTEKSRRHATRRFHSGDRWVPRLHNYYSSFGSNPPARFQSRTNIGLDGKPWARSPQRIPLDTPTTPELSSGNSMQESHVGIPVAGLLVEVFEQSNTFARPVTTAALATLESEFAALLADPTWDHARTLLPDGSVTTGAPSLDLSGSAGIFDAHIRCNPGEPGVLYLKAFEVTRGDQLSADALFIRTNERTGWSTNPEEQFLSATHFTIYEGDWEQYYAARFEVWFRPDAGTPERKLLDRTFKIDGWQH